MQKVDVAIAGGGLAGSLIAWRLKARRPSLKLALFDVDDRLGGDHLWSFHESDLDASVAAWLEPLVAHRWDVQDVRFPKFRRRLPTGYRSIPSDRLHHVVSQDLGEAVFLGGAVDALDGGGVVVDGRRIEAGAVIDARGARSSKAMSVGFQKFVGQVIRFSAPHGVTAPLIMDATAPQLGGYRFVYVLPFDEQTAMVEDTRYTDGDAMPVEEFRNGVADYCAGHGWRIDDVLREEVGVLPIALAGDIDAFLAEIPPGVAPAGMAAALFHPLTGYSLPDAARLAEAVSTAPDLSGPSLCALTREMARDAWRARGFYRLLARMLFGAADPGERYKVLERFYRLPEKLIERFYAGVSPVTDKARILSGKPPVPIGRAVGCLSEAKWLKTMRSANAL